MHSDQLAVLRDRGLTDQSIIHGVRDPLMALGHSAVYLVLHLQETWCSRQGSVCLKERVTPFGDCVTKLCCNNGFILFFIDFNCVLGIMLDASFGTTLMLFNMEKCL